MLMVIVTTTTRKDTTMKLFAHLFAASLALTFLAGTLAPPAEAGGSVAITVKPKNKKEARAMRMGLGVFALVKGAQNGHISQNGIGNIAGLAQGGAGNLGMIVQEGNNHSATLNQQGNNNAHGIFQFGKGSDVNANQVGDGETGMTVGFGW
jgi:hypothetical protein